MFGSLSIGAIGAVAFVTAIALHKWGRWQKWAPLAFMISGLAIGGFLGSLAATVGHAIVGGATSLASSTLGSGSVLIVLIPLGLYIVHKMWLNREQAGKLTYAIAFLTPSILGAAGLGGLVAMANNVLAQGAHVVPAMLGHFTG
ncbi:MAG: hypothetical protein J2P19_01815 [Pseudonocardia sp.]|nr:hypothetical protein [Pseudonocardia sp.]